MVLESVQVGALRQLARSERWFVRAELAQKGYFLEMFVRDPHPSVRKAVAEQGFGLEILVNDKELVVREAAVKMLEKQRCTEIDWILANAESRVGNITSIGSKRELER